MLCCYFSSCLCAFISRLMYQRGRQSEASHCSHLPCHSPDASTARVGPGLPRVWRQELRSPTGMTGPSCSGHPVASQTPHWWQVELWEVEPGVSPGPDTGCGHPTWRLPARPGTRPPRGRLMVLAICPLALRSYRSMPYPFHHFVNVPVFMLRLISHCLPVWTRKTPSIGGHACCPSPVRCRAGGGGLLSLSATSYCCFFLVYCHHQN